MAHVVLGCGTPLATSPPSGLGLSSSCRTFSNDPLRRSLRVKKRSQAVDPDKSTAVEARAGRNLTESPTSPTSDPFSTLGVDEYASKSEVKHVYRRLALQYHPDVCRGDHCALMFTQINLAYEKVMNYISMPQPEVDDSCDDNPEGFYGVGDDSWDEWEEWMGWEGAGAIDYSSHINTSI